MSYKDYVNLKFVIDNGVKKASKLIEQICFQEQKEAEQKDDGLVYGSGSEQIEKILELNQGRLR